MFLLFSPQVRDSQHQRLLLCAQPGQAGLRDGGGGVARGGDNHEGLDLGGHARGGVKVKNAKKYFVFLKKVFLRGSLVSWPCQLLGALDSFRLLKGTAGIQTSDLTK